MFQYNGIDIYDKNEKISAMSYGYDVYIYDVNETPPKVTLEVLNSRGANVTGGKNDYVTFDISNRLSAILETPY